LVKDKLKINLVVGQKQSQNNIFLFLQTLDNISFVFLDLNKFSFENKANFLFVIDSKETYNKIKTIFSKNIKYNNDKILFIVLKSLNLKNILNFNLIEVPEEINKIERQIYDFFYDGNFSYKNLYLKNSDVLVSTITDNEIILTEIESKILRLLFNNNEISKSKMSLLALGQNEEVESKSLESHLSRLRKKISLINDDVRIISDKGKIVKIL
tara:strand:- start:1293 stop:1928 length:636 start_codon:yes stop_codon:yes gene_type:complete